MVAAQENAETVADILQEAKDLHEKQETTLAVTRRSYFRAVQAGYNGHMGKWHDTVSAHLGTHIKLKNSPKGVKKGADSHGTTSKKQEGARAKATPAGGEGSSEAALQELLGAGQVEEQQGEVGQADGAGHQPPER